MGTTNNVSLTGTGVLAVAGIVVLGLVWWNRKAIGEAVGSAAQLVNPASDQNLAYRGVNGVGQYVSGDESWSLGGAIYDATHNDNGEPKVNTPPWYAMGPLGWIWANLPQGSSGQVVNPTPGVGGSTAVTEDEAASGPSAWTWGF